MSEKRFIVVKGCDNNVEKEGYFIQDTHYGVLKFGSFWKEKFAKEDCKRLNDVCELIEELHTSDHMGWGRAEKFEKELKQKKIYIKRLEYKVQKFKEENEQLKEELQRFKKYVFSEDNILCYKCEHCIKKDIYVVDCEMKGKVDVHGLCSLFREVKV